MPDRTTLLAFTLAGLCLAAPTARTLAAAPPTAAHVASLTAADDDDEKGGKKADPKKDEHEKDEHEGDDDDEKSEKKGRKEIEQKVPMAMVPAAVMDAVKKEVPDGTVTEAELVAKKGKIMYSFDVKAAGGVAYEVKVTVDGKFYSKKVDDDADDEQGDKAEKK